MINAEIVRNWTTTPGRQRYSKRDTILYALGAGAGLGNGDLQFVYESRLKALPTMAVVLAGEGFWMADPKTGIDWKKLLHGEQRLTIHRPLAPDGEVVSQMNVLGLYDRGEGKGAVLVLERELRDAKTNDLIATAGMTAMLLGDGGFGGSTEGLPTPHAMPEGEPDISVEMTTRPDQALIYRLSGDLNPLHIDPEVAAYAGFERPIIHGLFTYAKTGRAVISSLCENDPTRLKRLDVRFSRPVYPGDRLVVDIWRDGANAAALRVRAPERDLVVLSNGRAEFEQSRQS